MGESCSFSDALGITAGWFSVTHGVGIGIMGSLGGLQDSEGSFWLAGSFWCVLLTSCRSLRIDLGVGHLFAGRNFLRNFLLRRVTRLDPSTLTTY